MLTLLVERHVVALGSTDGSMGAWEVGGLKDLCSGLAHNAPRRGLGHK